jgi:flagellar motor switch protein FliM
MSAAAPVQAFDARHARGVSADARRVVDRWLRDASIRFTEVFTEFAIDAKASYQTLVTQDARTALTTLADPDAAAVINVGKAKVTTVLSFRTALLLNLLQGLLGVVNTEWPADRPLTPIEQSLAKLLFERIAAAFSDAWPSRDVLPTAFNRPITRTTRARLYDPVALLVIAKFNITTKAGDEAMYWVITQDHLEQLCADALPAPLPKSTPSPRMADLAPLVPVPFSVELGRVQLSVSEAESLKCGDVLVLEQAISDLLTGRVAGQAKFQGRPGRVGGRLCFEINSVVED